MRRGGGGGGGGGGDDGGDDSEAGSAERLIADAASELYGSDLDDFTATRAALVARAKKTGDAAAVKAIGALRKPTRSAWTVNRLARSAGAQLEELFVLGDALRSAQDALDGVQLRTLSAQRRGVVDALVEQALTATGQTDATAQLRAEVRATLDAALVGAADSEVRAEVTAGVLVRPASWSGFGGNDGGTAVGPALSLVPAVARSAAPSEVEAKSKAQSTRPKSARPNSPPPAKSTAPESKSKSAKSAAPISEASTQAEQRAQRDRAARQAREEQAEQARRREQERAAERRRQAREAVDTADDQLRQAVQAEKEGNRVVRLAQDQLADARRRLDEARLDVRQARSQQARAVRALRELS